MVKMHVLGICGTSGSGKTRLAKRLIERFTKEGHKVSVIKHAHHDVDVDTPGKDSWLLRKAGAYETMLISSKRWMRIKELEKEELEPDIDEIINSVEPCDWLIIEGFKHANLNKVEVWRQSVGKPAIYPHDSYVQAIVTDDIELLKRETHLPLHSTDDVETLFKWVIANRNLFTYSK